VGYIYQNVTFYSNKRMRDTYAGPVVQLAECVCEFGSLIHCRIYKNRSFNLNTDKTRQ